MLEHDVQLIIAPWARLEHAHQMTMSLAGQQLPIIVQLKQQYYHSAPHWTQRFEFLPPLMMRLLLTAGQWSSSGVPAAQPLRPSCCCSRFCS